MSGECDECGERTLECVCESTGFYTLGHICGPGCPCKQNNHNAHLNLIRSATYSLVEGEEPSGLPEVRYINVCGRIEHEAIIRDAEWCSDLGLDQAYEIMVYLKRWGGWLNQ